MWEECRELCHDTLHTNAVFRHTKMAFSYSSSALALADLGCRFLQKICSAMAEQSSGTWGPALYKPRLQSRRPDRHILLPIRILDPGMLNVRQNALPGLGTSRHASYKMQTLDLKSNW